MKTLIIPPVCLLLCSATFSQHLTEIRIAQTGPDLDEYVELAGTPGDSTDDWSFLVVGSAGSDIGIIKQVADLSGGVVPASGFFVIAESTFTLGTANLVTNLDFANDKNESYLLVENFTGSVGMDIDANDDQLLDTTPWSQYWSGVTVLNDPNAPGGTYGVDFLSAAQGVIGHVYFCFDAYSPGSLDVSMVLDSPGTFSHGCFGSFCDPGNLNSTGQSVSLVSTEEPGSPTGRKLQANNGPPSQFGYFLVGTGVAASPIVVSQGKLCLDTTVGQSIGRYNIHNTPMNSIGIFNPSGQFQNLSGTASSTGASAFGFDVPSTLPYGASPTIQSGETYFFQLWYRDQAAGQGVSNFSSGYAISF